MNAAARKLIAALALRPLRGEGGYFRRTWQSATASAIYFLLTDEDFSALHRLAQDEIWHFYAGDSIEHVQLDPRGGRMRRVRLGPAVTRRECAQLVVPAGMWQGARIAAGPRPKGWTLLGCTVSPPWDEAGFQLGVRADLLDDFPAHRTLIRALTR